MPLALTCLATLAPAILLLAGLAPAAALENRPWLAVATALTAFAAAALAAGGLLVTGPAHITLGPLGPAVHLDALSATMLVLVAFIGAIVTRFGATYLAGEAGRGRFLRWLCLTLAAVLALVIAGNLLMLALAWMATSLTLHQLLVHYRERPAAHLAARKKFLVSRVGDVALIAAIALAAGAFGTLDLAAIAEAARTADPAATPLTHHALAVLIVIAALLKSAQVPVHGWLTEVMETPTPVSALLHAGVINAGGFLVVRLADLVALSTPALDILAFVGGFTALFASVVMLTQSSVKVGLAWSTIAQMGFMMLQCGLGAFAAAVLHIVAHSLYKAHAFLTAGSVIDIARAAWRPAPHGTPHPMRLAAVLAVVLTAAWVASVAVGSPPTRVPGVFALASVLAMGVTVLLLNAADAPRSPRLYAHVAVLGGGAALAYFLAHKGAAWLLAGVVPDQQSLRSPLDLVVMALVIASFAAVTVLQRLMPHQRDHPLWRAAYVHLRNGLYLDTLLNRLVQRVWPVRVRQQAEVRT